MSQPSWSPSTTQQLRKLVAAPYLSPNDWTPRLDAYFASPLALCARRVSSAASRLLGSTSLRFALHGWQRMQNLNIREKIPQQDEHPDPNPAPGLVQARIPPGYNTNINVRFVPGRNIGDLVAIPKTCKPRNGKKHPKADLLALPDKLVAKLVASDKKMGSSPNGVGRLS
ncbi:hypothetical protein [Thiolapillus sp.]|uniref:hypothetical protein n=1 Tax=Thiolapillus sp. TaxID=2017437 RepID=UPI003AF982AA